ncbi:MAG TPA: RNA polymerase sigma factor [Bryobacteraceae bacterium]|jgi:RNA polymerase sigma-70 factor, ECF subfamily|nr:RNA polymerase sigma factor [Bryobacteraceae bacterium]
MELEAHALELDTRLMLGVKQGESLCMDLLLQRHRGPVIQFLYRMVRNRAIAEELAQNVFLRVYRSRTTYEPTAKFTSWLFRIATHVALNWLRDRRHESNQLSLSAGLERESERQIADRRPTVDQLMLKEVRLDEIRQAIAELPDRQRAAVIMHKYEELEYTQIAEALNCSPQTVKSLLFRAYNTLRVRLAHMAAA